MPLVQHQDHFQNPLDARLQVTPLPSSNLLFARHDDPGKQISC